MIGVAGLAKCIGIGPRTAFVVTPDARSGWSFVATMQARNVMASPLTAALVTRWIEDGTADTLLRFVRSETRARQEIARAVLPHAVALADPLSLHRLVALPGNRRGTEQRVRRCRQPAGSSTYLLRGGGGDHA